MKKMTKTVKIGSVTIGGGNPVAIQSMLNIPSYDIEKSVLQAKTLESDQSDIPYYTASAYAGRPAVVFGKKQNEE